MKRGEAELIGQSEVWRVIEEVSDEGEVAVVNGPVKSRVASRVLRVDVNTKVTLCIDKQSAKQREKTGNEKRETRNEKQGGGGTKPEGEGGKGGICPL